MILHINTHGKESGSKALGASLFACSLLTLLAIVYQRILWIITLDYPRSTGSYFYLNEIRAYLETGKGYYRSYSSFFWLVSLPGRIFGVDELTIYYAAICCSLLFFGAAAAVLAYSRRTRVVLPFLLALPWLSDVIFFRHFAFLEQAFSVSLLFLSFALVYRLRGEDTRFVRIVRGLAVVVSLFCMSMHMFTAALGALMFAAVAPFDFMKDDVRYWSLVFALFFIPLAAILGDKVVLQLIPAEFAPTWASNCDSQNCSAFEIYEFRLFALIYLVILIITLQQKVRSALLTFLLTAWLIFSIPIWNEQTDMAYRLAQATPWLVLLALALLCRKAKSPMVTVLVIPVVVFGIAAGSFLLPRTRYDLINSDFDVIRKNAVLLSKWVPKDAIVVAPHGMQFVVSYYLRNAALKRLDQQDSSRTVYRIMRLRANKSRRCPDISLLQDEQPGEVNCLQLSPHIRIQRIKP